MPSLRAAVPAVESMHSCKSASGAPLSIRILRTSAIALMSVANGLVPAVPKAREAPFLMATQAAASAPLRRVRMPWATSWRTHSTSVPPFSSVRICSPVMFQVTFFEALMVTGTVVAVLSSPTAAAAPGVKSVAVAVGATVILTTSPIATPLSSNEALMALMTPNGSFETSCAAANSVGVNAVNTLMPSTMPLRAMWANSASCSLRPMNENIAATSATAERMNCFMISLLSACEQA